MLGFTDEHVSENAVQRFEPLALVLLSRVENTLHGGIAMDKIVVGVFNDFTAAQLMAPELINAGIPKDAISVMAPDTSAESARYFPPSTETSSEATSNIGTGAALGGLGGILLGAVALTIPGLGLLMAAGPLATLIAGATAGVATGGLIGALNGMGIPEHQAQAYEAGVREGHSHVFVRTSATNVNHVAEIMRERHAVRVDINDVTDSPLPDPVTENRI